MYCEDKNSSRDKIEFPDGSSIGEKSTVISSSPE